MADADHEPPDEEELRRLFDKAAQEEYTRRALAKAREEFADYYVIAGGDDAALMDNLVLAREAASALNVAWRGLLSKRFRNHFETTSDKVDQLFAAWREAVRSSATFQKLSGEPRAKIEQSLFVIG